MSGNPEDPGAFVAWSRRRGSPVDPDVFAIRRDYRRYLQHVLDAAAAVHPGRFTHLRARATGLGVDGRVRLATDRAGEVLPDRVVLAIGHHSSPERPRQVSDAAGNRRGTGAAPPR